MQSTSRTQQTIRKWNVPSPLCAWVHPMSRQHVSVSAPVPVETRGGGRDLMGLWWADCLNSCAASRVRPVGRRVKGLVSRVKGNEMCAAFLLGEDKSGLCSRLLSLNDAFSLMMSSFAQNRVTLTTDWTTNISLVPAF
jgi:hypothetical protein